MPIYEYQCLKCGKRIEVLQRHDQAPPVCPECGSEVKKLISSPAFQFKGTGWYKTDYATKQGGSDSHAESKSESKSDEGGKAEKTDKAEKAEKAEKPKDSAAGAKSSGAGSSEKTGT